MLIQMVNDQDKDGSGDIDFQEFLDMICKAKHMDKITS